MARFTGGKVKVGDKIVCIHKDGRKGKGTVTKLLSHAGSRQDRNPEASAGNIIGLAGFEDVFIGETITDNPTRARSRSVRRFDPPTIKMQFVVNDSPLAGREGKFLTARHIPRPSRPRNPHQRQHPACRYRQRRRLQVSARGEMQIAILVEQMRREGFEVMVSRPEVIYNKDAEGQRARAVRDALRGNSGKDKLGDILENLANRKGEITNMNHHGNGLGGSDDPDARPDRLETDLVNLTRGEGIMSHLFKEYGPKRGEITTRKNGVARLDGNGDATGLRDQQHPGTRPPLHQPRRCNLQAGMVVGENSPATTWPSIRARRKRSPTCAPRATAKASSSTPRSRCPSSARSNTSDRTSSSKPRRPACACAKRFSTKTNEGFFVFCQIQFAQLHAGAGVAVVFEDFLPDFDRAIDVSHQLERLGVCHQRITVIVLGIFRANLEKDRRCFIDLFFTEKALTQVRPGVDVVRIAGQ
jgi:GTP-binding protein